MITWIFYGRHAQQKNRSLILIEEVRNIFKRVLAPIYATEHDNI